MKKVLKGILRCTSCLETNFSFSKKIKCNSCGKEYRAIGHCPVFHDDMSISSVTRTNSHGLPWEVEQEFLNNKGLILHLGSGCRDFSAENVIDTDYTIYPNTDVGIDAHTLPFRSNTFSSVFSLNVFEHLHDPQQALQEIYRVLVPNGKVFIQTAFLQPLHSEPIHYYNMTEYGVRRLFSDFNIESLSVPANFSPGFAVAWLVSNVLSNTAKASTTAEYKLLENSTLKDWSQMWRDLSKGKNDVWNNELITIINKMSEADQKSVALGFEIIARKPTC